MIEAFFKKTDQVVNFLSRKFSRTQLVFGVILLPSIIALVLPSLIFGKSIFTFLPASSDEIAYWREIKTFVDHGFGGGQYSTNELPAAFAASPFGSHGPAFAVLYGLIGKVFDWRGNSPIFIHFVLVPIVLGCSVYVARPDAKQLVVLAFLMATWWPLQLYMLSNMQEVLHMSIAVVLAALFYKYFQDRKSLYAYSIVAIVIFALPFRFIWGVILFPLILFASKKRTLKNLIFALLVTGIALLVGALFVKYFYSPYPWFSNELLGVFAASPILGLRMLGSHFVTSLEKLLAPGRLPLVTLVRYQILILWLVMALWLFRRYRPMKSKTNPLERNELVFHFVNLGSVLAFVLLFYDVLDTRDYRMFIAPLLLSSILFILYNRFKFAYSIFLTNILFLLFFLGHYSQSHFTNFNYDPRLLREVEEKIVPYLEFNATANRWCNTISVGKFGSAVNPLSYPLAVIPSGFGVTTILDWGEFRERLLRAQYVWLDPRYSEPGFGNPVNHFDLVLLSSTSMGNLYRNPLAPCEN